MAAVQLTSGAPPLTPHGENEPDAQIDPATGQSCPVAAPRGLLHGNFNAYWAVGTMLGLWFLFVHSPGHLGKRSWGLLVWDVVFVLHLIGAYVVYLVCMWNSFHTPSHGPAYCIWHIRLGRVAMVFGVFSFLMGFVSTWLATNTLDRGSAIGLTVGGAMQLMCQSKGWLAIRRWRAATSSEEKEQWITEHVSYMVGLFLPACGTPALLRFAVLFGVPEDYFMVVFGVALATMVCLIDPMTNAVLKQKLL